MTEVIKQYTYKHTNGKYYTQNKKYHVQNTGNVGGAGKKGCSGRKPKAYGKCALYKEMRDVDMTDDDLQILHQMIQKFNKKSKT